MKSELAIWLNYSQHESGGFGYTYTEETLNIAKTASGMISYAYLGVKAYTTFPGIGTRFLLLLWDANTAHLLSFIPAWPGSGADQISG